MAKADRYKRREGESYDAWTRRRKAMRKREDAVFNTVMALFGLLILGAIFMLVIWLRNEVIPCGWFTVQTAPLRCLPGLTR